MTGICLKYIFDALIVTFIKQVIHHFEDNSVNLNILL